AAGDVVGQGRVAVAVGLGLAIGGDLHGTLADVQAGADVGQVVVVAQGQGALPDGVAAHALAAVPGQRAREGVGEGQGAAGDVVGQGGVGIAVGLGLAIG